ncbi:esterase-like activity of phytase family protein [Dinoroseobacter sp. S76]|uniref:esterase-like activity of phytase family protein n=1 Tax=Dinoroseobacter sp. S76 TaxID=3415124 RepID=UPI003C7ABC62
MPASARLALIAPALATCLALGAGAAELSSVITLTHVDPEFGGLSALSVTEDGRQFHAIGDRGLFVRGEMLREANGDLREVTLTTVMPLETGDDGPVRPGLQDAEGSALTPEGDLLVSYEGFARIERFSPEGRHLARLPHPAVFNSLQRNSSLEALAADERGWVYTVPERSGKLDRPFPVYRFDGRRWDTPFALPRRGDFLVVGMDFGPDGHLYLLERALRGVFFSTRVRRFEIAPEGRITREETLLETPTGTHENLEGLAVWRDPEGRLRLTMVADDNFNLFLRNQIVEYRLD